MIFHEVHHKVTLKLEKKVTTLHMQSQGTSVAIFDLTPVRVCRSGAPTQVFLVLRLRQNL